MNDTLKEPVDCDGNLLLQVVYGLIGVVAILTNSLIIFVHWKFESVRNPTHFIPAIAVIDALMGVAAFVKVHIFGVCEYTYSQRDCVLLELPFVLSACSNAPLMLLLSSVRYISYKQPQLMLSYRIGWLVGLAYGLVAVYALFGASFHLWSVWEQNTLMKRCSLLEAAGGYASGKFMLATLMLMCIGIVLANFKLHYAVKKRLQNSSAGTDATLRDTHVTQSIIGISLIYLLTFFAGILCRNLMVNLVSDDRIKAEIGPYFTILLFLNCTTNFFVYAFRGSEYRQALKLLFFGQNEVSTLVVPLH